MSTLSRLYFFTTPLLRSSWASDGPTQLTKWYSNWLRASDTRDWSENRQRLMATFGDKLHPVDPTCIDHESYVEIDEEELSMFLIKWG